MLTGNGHRNWRWSRPALPMRLLPMPRIQACCRASPFQLRTSTALTIHRPSRAPRHRCPHPGKPKVTSSAVCVPNTLFFRARHTQLSSLLVGWASTVIGEPPEIPGTQIPIVSQGAPAVAPESACVKVPRWLLWDLTRRARYGFPPA